MHSRVTVLPVAEDVGKMSELDIVRDGTVSDVIMVADATIGDDGNPVSSAINKGKKNQNIPVKHSSIDLRQEPICPYTLSRPRSDILLVKSRSCWVKFIRYTFSIIKKMTLFPCAHFFK